MDQLVTIAQLKEQVRAFRDARNWAQFHKPKDLAAALSIECGELQELFLWKSDEAIAEYLETEAGAAKLREELADCFIFLLHLADGSNVDLAQAVRNKLALNEKKYPVEKSFNSNAKYTEWNGASSGADGSMM